MDSLDVDRPGGDVGSCGRWFAELINNSIRRGSFSGVGDLVVAIHEFLEASNRDPTVYVWTASAAAIMEKLARCKAILQTKH